MKLPLKNAASEIQLSDAAFGQILGDAGPRILQFALKYTF